MQDKNLIVFLHGLGQDKTSQRHFIEKMAQKLEADIFSLDAPFESGKMHGGYRWFDREIKNDEMHVLSEKFNCSVDYINNNVSKELKERGLEWSNVILCGHSQGATMAAHVGVSMAKEFGVKKIICLCGDFPYNLEYTKPIHKDTPIYWIEGGKDAHFNAKRKASYKLLQKMGCNVKHFVSANSTHDVLDYSIVDLVE